MSPGKCCSQTGHAYLGAFVAAPPQSQADYHAELPDHPGTKVCLRGSLKDIEKAHRAAQDAGIPSFLVVDSGCPDFYDGKPTITALGIGPATREQARFLRRLQVMP